MTREERNKEIQEELKRKEEQKETLKKVGKVTKIVLIIVLIISSFILYARFVSTSFLVVREYKVTSPNLPTNFTGFKIVQFSDLYYGSTIDTEDLQDIVDKINELKPDLVVFTGDLIAPNYTLEDGEQENITNLLKSITSTVGKYAVNGNNDIQNEVFESILLGSDFKYLNNESDFIYYQNQTPILLSGTSTLYQGNADVTKTFQDKNTNAYYTISLMHEPDQIETIVANRKIDLALAGHSLNGQIRIPRIGAIIHPMGAQNYPNEHYLISTTSNTTELFVSGGLGTDTAPFRLFNHPSINFYRLYKS